MENEWLSVVISPEQGARIVGLADKRAGRSWTSLLPDTVAPGGSGMLLDRFWGDRQIRDLESSPYQVAEAAGRSVRLVRVHKVGDREGFVVEKTISLPADRASVVVEYSVSNISTGDWEGRFWVASLLRPDLGPAEPLMFHFPVSWHRADYRARPGVPGRWRFDYQPDQEQSQNIWISRPTAGWAAVTAPGGAGVVMLMDGAYVDDLYCYMPVGTATGGHMATLEAMYGPLLLRPTGDDAARDELGIPPLVGMADPGKPWRTRIELVPVTDLGEMVFGAADGLVIGATLTENDITLAASSTGPTRLTGKLTVRAIPDGEPVPVGDLDLALQPTGASRLGFALPAQARGSVVFELRGTLDGTADVTMFLPIFVEPGDARRYSEEPQFEPATDFKPQVRFADLPPEAETEHVAWLRPLRRAPLLLMLVPAQAVWGYYELAQRFDAQIDVVPVSYPHYLVYGADPMGVDPNRLLPHLLAQPHDAIVLPAGLCWATLPEEVRDLIVAQVEQGTGLVYVSPTLGDHLFPDVPGVQKEVLTECEELPGVAERLVRGVPRESIPVFARYADLAGRVHAGRYGEGRVVVYDIPIWPERRPYLVRDLLTPAPTVADVGDAEFGFREYHHLLAGRLLAWAAGVEPPLSADVVVAADRDAGLSATLRLTNALDQIIAATARVRWLNRRGEEIGSEERALTAPPGDSEATFEAANPGELLPGIVLAEALLTDADGLVVGSAAGATMLRAAPRVQAVALDHFAHEPGEPVAGSVAVEGLCPEGARLVVRVSDVHGRLLAEEAVPVPAVGPDEVRPVRFALTPGGALSVLHRVDATLRSGGGSVLDAGWAEFTIAPGAPEDVTFQIWGPRYSPADPAGELEARIMRRVGFDYAVVNASVAPPEEVRREALGLLRLDLRPMTMNLMRIAVTPGAMEGVERDPCLSSPEFRASLREHAGRYAQALRDLFPVAHFNGDENSLGSYSKPHDFCQAPDTLAKFRDFLRGKYATVERLNAEWGTGFAAWDEVRPFTLAQARESGNWAPWVEHRTWMATELADILAFQSEIIHEADPNGRLAVSGMGVPSIYNGFDWSRLMPHLNHMAGYARQSGGAYRSELFRSFARPDALLGTWTGYEADLDFVRDSIWWEVLSGFFCPAYYCSDFLHTPGLTETEAAEDLARTFAEVRSGLGKLIMGGERLEDPI
ncbi:MAG TPA: beta-galactosidase, partial [Armatimonadota bacterium]|nr:beta-galactosidase [Armatimonadota bacterium]